MVAVNIKKTCLNIQGNDSYKLRWFLSLSKRKRYSQLTAEISQLAHKNIYIHINKTYLYVGMPAHMQVHRKKPTYTQSLGVPAHMQPQTHATVKMMTIKSQNRSSLKGTSKHRRIAIKPMWRVNQDPQTACDQLCLSEQNSPRRQWQ